MLPHLTKLYDKQMQITESAKQDRKQKASNRGKARENTVKRARNWINLLLLHHHFDWLKRNSVFALICYGMRGGSVAEWLGCRT